MSNVVFCKTNFHGQVFFINAVENLNMRFHAVLMFEYMTTCKIALGRECPTRGLYFRDVLYSVIIYDTQVMKLRPSDTCDISH
jgi:hypothetical protein